MQLVADVLSNSTSNGSRATMQEVGEKAARFEQPHLKESGYRSEGRSARGIEQLLSSNGPNSNYNTNTFGSVTFRRMDEPSRPNREPLVADRDLQSRLEVLCESLRSRY